MSNATLEDPKQQAATPAATPAVTPETPPAPAAATPETPAALDACPVTDYDWHVPRRFVPAERRKIDALAAKAAQRVATDVGNLLRRQLALEACPVTEQYGAVLWNPAAKPEYAIQLTDKAGRVCGMLTLPPQAALGWVEQLLGGGPAAETGLKPLSALEAALLLDIAAVLVKAFSVTAQELGGPNFQQVENVFTEQSPLAGCDTDEFCRFALVTEMGQGRLEIGLAVLSSLLAPVADPDSLKKKPRPPEELRKELTNHLGKSPVKVTAWLGKSVVTMRDVSALEPGDVLLLSSTLKDPIEILVMGNTVHMGYLAACDGCYAVQIVERREWPRAKLQGKGKKQ
jgi:flagellar motor switch protein FliM